MRSVAFHTLGCKVNQYETEAIQEMFSDKGYRIINFDQKADVYIINTCTVTNMADKKSRQMISKAKKINSESIIVVIGCYAQIAGEKILEIDGVNLVIGSDGKNEIVKLVEQCLQDNTKINVVDNIRKITEFENLTVRNNTDKTRGYIKIQDGCNQYCSYCIIPYTRGPIRSRNIKNIVDEVNKLVDNGYKEVVLTGIHVASYGKDLDNINLLDVIKVIHDIEGIKRIRLSSIEPTMVDEKFVQAINKLPKVCPHYHLSLQSGCDKTLKEMNRKYTTEEFLESVNLLRKYIKDVSLTTDIIVGFPGETDEDFNTTMEFVHNVNFNDIHVFKYSPREGTPAAKRKDQIQSSIKDIRSHKLIELKNQLKLENIKTYIGLEKKVLIENYSHERDLHEGYTGNYIKVFVKTNENIVNEIVNVKLENMKMLNNCEGIEGILV